MSIYSPGGHFVQRRGTVWAILVEGHPGNIPVLLFENRCTAEGGQVVSYFFYF